MRHGLLTLDSKLRSRLGCAIASLDFEFELDFDLGRLLAIFSV
jgi:hypothetical protein